jgi:hypothetical protein
MKDANDEQNVVVDLEQDEMPTLECDLASWKQILSKPPTIRRFENLGKFTIEILEILLLLLGTPGVQCIGADVL